MKEIDKKEKFWLYAVRDQLAGIQAFSNCVTVANLYGDGDYKLIIADSKCLLKVFEGAASLVKEIRLHHVPSAVAVFYPQDNDAVQRPVVAVSCGPYIFMYRNMLPLYRFLLPPVGCDDVDEAVWEALRNRTISVGEAADLLDDRRKNGVMLSTRSTDLLASDSTQEREKFVELMRDVPLHQMTVVTCMSSLFLNSAEEGGRSCLVFGTENSFVYILKSTYTEVHLKTKIPDVPVFILTTGALRVEYRIIVACRDGCIYSIKNGKLSAVVIYADGQIVQIARYNNLVAVATTQNTLSFFSLKGKCLSSIHLPFPVTNIATITESVTGQARAIIVALNNGAIRVYVGSSLVHESQAYGTVTSMHFGRYGREDAALVLVLQNGSILVEILHRHALSECDKRREFGPPTDQDVPIPVPSLTSLFVAQAERERAFCADMHRSFQRDLCQVRLNAAKSYLALLLNGENTGTTTMSSSPSDKFIRLFVEVQGVGPVYRLRTTLQNIADKPVFNLMVLFGHHPSFCKLSRSLVDVPFLTPSVLSSYNVIFEMQESDLAGVSTDAGEEAGIRVYIVTPSSSAPLASAFAKLPDRGSYE